MECRGLLRGMLLWDRTGSASGELACIISGLEGPHPSALKPATANAAAAATAAAAVPAGSSSAAAGGGGTAGGGDRDGSAAPASGGFLEGGESAAFLLPKEGGGGAAGDDGENRGVELQWLFTGRVSYGAIVLQFVDPFFTKFSTNVSVLRLACCVYVYICMRTDPPSFFVLFLKYKNVSGLFGHFC